MQFKIHNEGWVYFVSSAILTIILLPFFKILMFFLLILSIFIFYFFRDPKRSIPADDFIVAPADGIITYIGETKSPLNDTDDKNTYKKISIFLSIFNVHVNRMPVDGKIMKIKYFSGNFFNASLDKSSDKNERNIISIENNSQKYYVVQIAGLIARRIVCEVNENQELNKGDKLGIIKFGSRVDLYLPNKCELLVAKDQNVIGGETIVSNPNSLKKINSYSLK